jgi:hypothetical protein
LTVTTDVKGVKLLLTVDTKRVIESMQLPKTTEWNQYYYRFLANYEMKMAIDGIQDQVRGEMLHELMML